MSSHVELSIAGAPVILKDKYRPRLTTRKIYNAAYFRDEQYRHEIANHYRDFKQRPRIRRKRRSVVVRYCRSATIGIDSYEYRHVLPVPVQNFPRFAEVYTPRGRQTLCESQPPDGTYNDSVRRIRAANSCKEFEGLVQRQLDWARNSTRRTAQKFSWGGQRRWTKPPVQWHDDDYDNNDDSDYVKEKNFSKKSNPQRQSRPKQQQQQQRRRRSLGNLESVANRDARPLQQQQHKHFARLEAKGGKASGSSQPPHADKANDKLTYYLQLATEHYEQGFLSNIRYLESIGERNALIRRSGGNCRRPRNPANTLATSPVAATTAKAAKATSRGTSRTASAISNASDSTATSTDHSRTPRVQVDDCFRLTALLKRIGRKRTFRIGDRSWPKAAQFAVEEPRDCTSTDWAIRVNITPAGQASAKGKSDYRKDTTTTTRTTPTITTKPEHTEATLYPQQSQRGIMNDYLNANSQSISKATSTYSNASRHFTATAKTAQQTHFHELIDNLMQLEINDIDLSLPKITLTDCSTSTTATTTSTQPAETEAQQNVEAYYGKRRVGTFILKQSKFNTSLDIPNEPNYHSEARPP